MIEVRTPGEDDRAQVLETISISLDVRRRDLAERAERLRLNQFRCAFEGDRVLATAAARPFEQWFGGRTLPMTGVYAVTTLPEHRGAGLASRCVQQLLHEDRERGVPLSALYPATLRPYRRLGFELAGTYTRHEVGLDDLPEHAGPLAVDEYRPEDLPAVRACYRLVAGTANGPIDCEDEDWWPLRILGSTDPSRVHRAAVARDETGAVRGYLAFVKEPAEGHLDVSFRMTCTHFIASDAEALRSLLGYVRGFRGLGRSISFLGPPIHPLSLLVPEQRLLPAWSFRWMLRPLDVPGALQGRGYPPVRGESTIAVDDPLFADNRGPWRIEADGGSVRVDRVDADAGPPIHVRTLSALYTGFLSVRDAVRVGLLDAHHPAIAFLADLFTGPTPFMYDFF